MAIAYDSSSGGTSSATSLTVSHTCSGQNRCLVVMLNGGGDSGTLKYAGVTMTQVANVMAVLKNPAEGANNIVWTKTDSANLSLSAASYTGVNQDNFPDSNGYGTVATGGTTIIGTAIPTKANCWMVSGGKQAIGGQPVGAGAGVTLRNSQVLNAVSIGDSNGVIGVAGTQSWNFTSSAAQLDMSWVTLEPAPTQTYLGKYF